MSICCVAAVIDLIVASITAKYTQSNSVGYAFNGQMIGKSTDRIPPNKGDFRIVLCFVVVIFVLLFFPRGRREHDLLCTQKDKEMQWLWS